MAKELNMLNKSLQENLDLTAYSQVGHTHNYAGSSTVGGAANTAVKLHTARSINGTKFDGSGNITTANWGTARNITIGSTSKSVNGSANVGWTLAEIGAAPTAHNHTFIESVDTRSTNPDPNTYTSRGITPEFKSASGIGLPNVGKNFAGVLTYQQWSDTSAWSGGKTTQFATIDDGRMYYRKGDGSGWGSWYQFYTTQNKPTYSDVGAAAASHGTHVTYATATPLANGTAAVGSSAKVAREDHVHPLQTTISGAAGSAGKWTTARTLTIGNSGKSVDGSANVSWSLSEIGALPTAGGTMTGNIKFTDVTSTTYPAKSAMLTWNGSTDGADIYYQVDASDKGRLVLNTRDDADCIFAFANKGTIVSTIDNSGNFSGKASKAGNADTATKLATGRSITIGNQAQTFDGSGNISFSIASIGASESGHTHNYAGSSSAGGAANSVKTNLIIKLNNGGTEGTDLFTFNGSTAKTVNITPNAIGAAASSHGTHVTYSTSAPLVAGTAAVGSANNVARGDHVHPAQTSVTGNAGTATKLATARTIQIGNKSNTFNGSANITYTLADIGAKATEPTTFGLQSGYVAVRTAGRTAAQHYEFWDTDAGWAGIKAGAIYDNNNRVYSASNKPTLSDLGAAAASHGTHVTWSTTTPKANGTAAVGTETKVARGDHVHPLQTSVSGNAGTATKLATARTITIGNKSNSFDGSANISYTLAEIGAIEKAGDIMTGELILMKGSRVHTADGTSGTSGYVFIAQIIFSGTYQNQPIYMQIAQRGYDLSTLEMRFSNVNNADPALTVFNKTGNVEAYLYKSATSTWDLFIKKSEAYDKIDIVDFKKGQYMQFTNIFWANTLSETLPTGSVAAQSGNASITAVASNLSGVTINGYDSIMSSINTNIGKL